MCQHLWSVLSAEVKKRQSSNPNNTIIDIADKAKQILSIITTDKKEFILYKTEVNPQPVYGCYN